MSFSEWSSQAVRTDSLVQIAQLSAELDPQTRSPRCPECGASQLVYCEESHHHYCLADADKAHWWFGGASETVSPSCAKPRRGHPRRYKPRCRHDEPEHQAQDSNDKPDSANRQGRCDVHVTGDPHRWRPVL